MAISIYPAQMAAVTGNGDLMVDMAQIMPASASPSYTPTETDAILTNAGFTRDSVARIFEDFWADVEAALDDGSFINFYNAQGEKDKADIKEAGRARSYSTRADLALEMATNLAKRLNVGNRTARFSTEKDDMMGNNVIISKGGEIIINSSSSVWNISPNQMTQDIIRALSEEETTRKKIINRYVDANGKNVNIASLKPENHKIITDMFFDTVRHYIPQRFPETVLRSYEEDARFYNGLDKDSREYTVTYNKQLNDVKTNLAKFYQTENGHSLKPEEITKNINEYSGKFFADLDKLTDMGNVFGGCTLSGDPIKSGFTKIKTQTSHGILEDILTNDKMKGKEFANMKANALVRMIDLTFSKEEEIRNAAISYLTRLDSNNQPIINQTIAELNEAIAEHNAKPENKDYPWKKITTAEIGIIKDNDGHYVFDGDFVRDAKGNPVKDSAGKLSYEITNEVLNTRRKLVINPPFAASDELWRQVDQAYATKDKATLKKLDTMAIEFELLADIQTQSQSKNFTALNAQYLHYLRDIHKPFSLDDEDTWAPADIYLRALIEEARKDEKIKASDNKADFFALCNKIEDAIKGKNGYEKLNPNNVNDLKTIINLRDMFTGMRDDITDVVAGNGFSFNAEDAEREFDKIMDAHKDATSNDVLHKPFTGSFGSTYIEIFRASRYDACHKMEAIANRVKKNIDTHSSEYLAHLNIPGNAYSGKTATKINKVKVDSITLDNGEPSYTTRIVLESGCEIITDGVNSRFLPRDNDDKPQYEDFLAWAEICKEEERGVVGFSTTSYIELYEVALALAINGLDYTCAQIKLEPKDEELINRVRNIARRHSEDIKAGGTNEAIYNAIQEAKNHELSPAQANKMASLLLYGNDRTELLQESKEVLNKRARYFRQIEEMTRNELIDLAKDFIYATNTFNNDDAGKEEFLKRFNKKVPTADDITKIIDWMMKDKDNDAFVQFQKLNDGKIQRRVWDNPTPSVAKPGTNTLNADFKAYQEDQKAFIAEMGKTVADIKDRQGNQKYPKTAALINNINKKVVGSKNYLYVEASAKALISIGEKAKEGAISDSELAKTFAVEQVRQGLLMDMTKRAKTYTHKIDTLSPEAKAHNPEFSDSANGYKKAFIAFLSDMANSTIHKEWLEGDDKIAKRAMKKLSHFDTKCRKISQMIDENKSEEEIERSIEERQKILIRDFRRLDTHEILAVTKAYAKGMGMDSIHSYQDFVLAENAEVATQISNAHNDIMRRSFADDKLSEIAFYVFAKAANAEDSERKESKRNGTPVSAQTLLDAINDRSVRMFNETGFKALASIKSVEELQTITLNNEEISDLKNKLGIKKKKSSEETQKDAENLMNEVANRIRTRGN